MTRNVVAGLVVGMAVNMALVLLNAYVLFPMPEGMDMSDVETFNAYIATLPTAAFLSSEFRCQPFMIMIFASENHYHERLTPDPPDRCYSTFARAWIGSQFRTMGTSWES